MNVFVPLLGIEAIVLLLLFVEMLPKCLGIICVCGWVGYVRVFLDGMLLKAPPEAWGR